mgnify:CR=1 FL=1
MKKKKSLFMAIALLVLLIVIIAGSTYAYFIATINNDNAVDADIQARTLGLHFEDGAEINLPDALPGQTVIKKFSVENTGTESTTYNIYINDLINQFINTDEVVYELSSTNGGATITERAFPTASGVIASNIEIPKDTTQEYTMTIRYINTNSSQNIDMGKKISGVIQILPRVSNTARMVVGEFEEDNTYLIPVFYTRGSFNDSSVSE